MLSSARHALRYGTRRNNKNVNASLGRLVMIVAIVEPLMTLPQVFQIWTTKDVHSLSLATWILYIFASSVWFFYGLKIRNTPLVVTGALWTIMEAAVIAGILVWR